ncbi:MAG: hypothetical protein ACJ785_05635 [Gemmatimonadaceae bacterium]
MTDPSHVLSDTFSSGLRADEARPPDLEVSMSMRGIAMAGGIFTLFLACAKDDSPGAKAELTQREKDSIFAQSQIPGARAVKKTLTTADSAAARQARIDSAQQNP